MLLLRRVFRALLPPTGGLNSGQCVDVETSLRILDAAADPAVIGGELLLLRPRLGEIVVGLGGVRLQVLQQRGARQALGADETGFRRAGTSAGNRC
jgi:hypothetical protein